MQFVKKHPAESHCSLVAHLWQVAITSRSGYPVSFLQVVDGVLYAIINDDNEQSGDTRSYLAAFNISTGAQIWKTASFAGDGLSSFTVANHVMYFGLLHTAAEKSFTGEVFAYDLQSHKQLWSQHVNGGIQQALVVTNGMVYVAGDGGNTFPAEAVALNATTGAITWQKHLDSPMTDGFCVSNGVVYVGNYKTATEDKTVDGMYALNTATGKQVWKDTAGGSPQFIIPTTDPGIKC
ncbi:MAG: PQQ-binding-like beta-propeller repeat protein [Ktedonobacteraceae bacterium]